MSAVCLLSSCLSDFVLRFVEVNLSVTLLQVCLLLYWFVARVHVCTCCVLETIGISKYVYSNTKHTKNYKRRINSTRTLSLTLCSTVYIPVS